MTIHEKIIKMSPEELSGFLYANRSKITSSNKCYDWLTQEKLTIPLRKVDPGATVKIGDMEFIVLKQQVVETAAYLVSKNPVGIMEYDEMSANYEKSHVREYCNTNIFSSLSAIIGKDNIYLHTVRLRAEDGTGRNKEVRDLISIPTTDMFREYRDYFEFPTQWFWTATQFSLDNDSRVCFVNSDGTIDWSSIQSSGAVRPVCFVNANIEVEYVVNREQ